MLARAVLAAVLAAAAVAAPAAAAAAATADAGAAVEAAAAAAAVHGRPQREPKPRPRVSNPHRGVKQKTKLCMRCRIMIDPFGAAKGMMKASEVGLVLGPWDGCAPVCWCVHAPLCRRRRWNPW